MEHWSDELHRSNTPTLQYSNAQSLQHSTTPFLHFSTPPRSTRAFSLFEVIGVLAIIAVLSLALAPVLIRRIDQAARDRETAEMNGIATALRSAILRTGEIPDSSTLVAVVANEMAVSSNQVALSGRKVPRRFLIDTDLWIGSTNGLLPYIQSQRPFGTGTNSGGVDVPGRNLRLLILSSLSVALPTNIDFSTAWNTADGAVPPGWSWAGRADDLKIQRLDLAPLFHRVILNPIDTNKFGSFAIESGTNVSATPNVTQIVSNSWYLHGTTLRLCDTNSGSTAVEFKAAVQGDVSYVFEDLAWRGLYSGHGTNSTPVGGTSGGSAAFQQFMTMATPFTNYPSGPAHQSGVTPNEVLRGMFSVMVNYTFWAKEVTPSYPTGFAMGSRTANTILNQEETIVSGSMGDLLK